MSRSVLEMRAIDKSYRRGPEEIHALRDASLALAPGELVALVGPSGSGKTTLLNVIAGWEESDSGTMIWEGTPLPRGGADLAWTDLAILPQSLGLIEELSIRENVDLPVRLRAGAPAAETEVTSLLGSLGLSALADRYPDEVSLGEQQRAALARCLAHRPKLMMADEPTGHQDVGWARTLLQTIRQATSAGTACLMVTHHAAAAGFADRVLAIKDGSIAPADDLDTDLLGDDL
jgi:putative ABC transport system ATP-binding protein